MRITFTPVLLALIAGMVLSVPGSAQAPGYANITTPRDGDEVHGLVTIIGSAFHPSFEFYDLAFAYPDDPTNTWFQIGDQVESPIREGELGIWDTSGISEGEYQLRLRVVLTNGTVIETLVNNLQISRQPSLASPTPFPQVTRPEGPLPVVSSTATPTMRPTLIPPESVDGVDRARSVFQFGFLLGGIGFVVVGLALIVIRGYGRYTASMRMREVHRPPSRRRRKGRR